MIKIIRIVPSTKQQKSIQHFKNCVLYTTPYYISRHVQYKYYIKSDAFHLIYNYWSMWQKFKTLYNYD